MNPTPRARGASRLATVLIGTVSVLSLAIGSLVLAEAARAAFVDVPPTGTPGRLVLASDPYPAEFLAISPGSPSYWQVAARLENATTAQLSLELRKAGDLVVHPRGLVMTVDSCTQPWSGMTSTPSCAPGGVRVTQATPAEDYSATSPTFALQPLQAGSPEYLLVTLAVENSTAAMADDTLMGLTGSMGLGLTATTIDGVPVTPGSTTAGSLPNTGLDQGALGVVALIALTAGLLGLVLVMNRMRSARSLRLDGPDRDDRPDTTERGR